MSQQMVDPKVMTRSMALVSPTKTYKSEKLTLKSSPSSADVYQPPGLISPKAEEDPPRSPSRAIKARPSKALVYN
jgi:hypothetical protein